MPRFGTGNLWKSSLIPKKSRDSVKKTLKTCIEFHSIVHWNGLRVHQKGHLYITFRNQGCKIPNKMVYLQGAKVHQSEWVRCKIPDKMVYLQEPNHQASSQKDVRYQIKWCTYKKRLCEGLQVDDIRYPIKWCTYK